MRRFNTVNRTMRFSVAYLHTEGLLTFEITSYGPSYGRCNGPRCVSCPTNTYLVLRMLSGTNDFGALCADVRIVGGIL